MKEFFAVVVAVLSAVFWFGRNAEWGAVPLSWAVFMFCWFLDTVINRGAR